METSCCSGGGNGVTIYSKKRTQFTPLHSTITTVIGLIDAAVVAIAVSISNGFSVSDTTLLTNAACECILSAEATDSFSLSKDMLIHRVGEIAWNLQVSKR